MPPQALGLAMDVPFMSCRTCCVLQGHRRVSPTAAAQSTAMPFLRTDRDKLLTATCAWQPRQGATGLEKLTYIHAEAWWLLRGPEGRLTMRSLQAASQI